MSMPCSAWLQWVMGSCDWLRLKLKFGRCLVPARIYQGEQCFLYGSKQSWLTSFVNSSPQPMGKPCLCRAVVQSALAQALEACCF